MQSPEDSRHEEECDEPGKEESGARRSPPASPESPRIAARAAHAAGLRPGGERGAAPRRVKAESASRGSRSLSGREARNPRSAIARPVAERKAASRRARFGGTTRTKRSAAAIPEAPARRITPARGSTPEKNARRGCALDPAATRRAGTARRSVGAEAITSVRNACRSTRRRWGNGSVESVASSSERKSMEIAVVREPRNPRTRAAAKAPPRRCSRRNAGRISGSSRSAAFDARSAPSRPAISRPENMRSAKRPAAAARRPRASPPRRALPKERSVFARKTRFTAAAFRPRGRRRSRTAFPSRRREPRGAAGSREPRARRRRGGRQRSRSPRQERADGS